MVGNFSWKDGWRPERKPSQFKGIDQMKSLVNGKLGKDTSPSYDRDRQPSKPLSSLPDPSSFPPPPKKTGSFGSPAVPPRRHDQQAPDTTQAQPPPQQTSVESLNTGRYPQYQQTPQSSASRQQEQQSQPPPPPPRNTSTSTTSSAFVNSRQQAYPTPQSANSKLHSEDEVLASTPGLNTSAMGRLGAAGVAVPGLEIGRGSGQQSAKSQPPPFSSSQKGRMGEPVRDELQSWFGRRPVSSQQQEQEEDSEPGPSAVPPPLPRHPLDSTEPSYYQPHQQQQCTYYSTLASLSSAAKKKPPAPPPKKPNLQLH